MDSTFPTAAHAALCSVLLARTDLILHQCVLSTAEPCWHSIRTPTAPSLCHPPAPNPVGWLWARGGEGALPGQLTQKDQRDSPYGNVTLSNKSCGRGGRRGGDTGDTDSLVKIFIYSSDSSVSSFLSCCKISAHHRYPAGDHVALEAQLSPGHRLKLLLPN